MQLSEILIAIFTAIFGSGLFAVAYWLRRLTIEFRKHNELTLRFKKMEFEAARNGRRH